MQHLRTCSLQTSAAVSREAQQKRAYGYHCFGRKSQQHVLRQQAGSLRKNQYGRQTAIHAKTGSGGGVLDRPAVLPGYDNKYVRICHCSPL